ncbi:MAG: hypothetical protein K2J31_06830 [Alistipes sp.]|nr:hypothetical protein [Alistipes sp.]
MSRTDFSLALEMTKRCHSEEQRSCDVGVSLSGALFAATKEILTSDVPSSSE